MWTEKKIWGLNLQASCDHFKRFTSVSIIYPASTSDFLAFETSRFHTQIKQEGFLAEGLCLYGDNAYVNTMYMATPFPNVSASDSRDAYNFYHSQVRINIECAFGILVNRWAILRKITSHKFTIKKICGLVTCLCQLHNFLIERAEVYSIEHATQDETELAEKNQDGLNQYVAVSTHNSDDGEINYRVDELIGNHHFDDDERGELRQIISRSLNRGELPREILHKQICDKAMRRPNT